MTAIVDDLVGDLARAGIRLKLVDGDRIQVSAPPGRLSGDLRGRITRYKPQLLAWLAAADREPPAELPRIQPDPARADLPFPPSDLQTAFLMGSQEGLEYHVRPHGYTEFELGDVDPERFAVAWNRAVQRHRRSIAVVGDDLMLHVVPDPGPVPVPVTDLRGRDGAAELARVREQMERREPEHYRWPWMDLRLTRYGDGQTRLHLNNNTFFVDAPGSVRLLERALDFYHHPEWTVPNLELSYRDCVLALAELEKSPRGEASRRYWTDRVPTLPGPPDVPLNPGSAYRGRSWLRRRELLFPPETAASIKQQAKAHGVTLTSTLLAAHAEVLAYWSGSRHFVLNNMVTHRLPLHPEMTEVLGNFASLYPLEVDWRPEEPFGDRVRRLQAQVMTDLSHLYYPGVKVLQQLSAARRTPGRAVCPFAVGSALFVGPAQRPAYSMLETPQTVLDTEFWELADGRLWVIWDVIEEAFPAGLLDAMADGYRTVVRRLASGEVGWDERALDLLPAGQPERRAGLNRPAVVPADGLLHKPLARQAETRPRRAAVVTGDRTLTYTDLRDRAGTVAARLRAAGVRAGDRVAVVADKGWPQVVAVLGALTAGAVYVPIDPAWPDRRRAYLLTDTAARAALTTAALRDGLDWPPDLPLSIVDDDGTGPAQTPANGSPDEPAYVIYTSGSTGAPKGALLNHRGPVNTIEDINRRFDIGPDDVLFGVSSLCFDLSVYDIFGAIAAGATLVLPAAGQTDPAGWLPLVRRHRVTVWNSVPALMQLFVEAASAAGASLPDLRVVLLSGDWIPVGLPDRIRAVAPNARVISLGGATEASIWSIAYPIGTVDPAWPSIPYGRPLTDQSWYVLDAAGRDAPTWVPGHLYIGGTGLALGYLGDPVRTAAAFVRHPRTGERLYRTGDLGRYLPSGDIEFLGRADFQLKIHGYRVEPGEIEQALLAHPEVREAAVIGRAAGTGRQLAAFVTGTPALDRAALREFLVARLPGYLVPSHITVLERLPLSGNGKVDRTALERRQLTPPVADPAPPVAEGPASALELSLVDIWESILDSRPIGRWDNFFDLGGDSFAALRVSNLIAQRLDRRVPLGVLLERPTIAGLADWWRAADPPSSPLVRLRADGTGEPWFFVHPAGGNVVCYRELAGALGAPFVAFQAYGPALPRTVEEFAGRYLAELRRLRPDGPYRLGGWSSGAVIAAEMARQLTATGAEVSRLVVLDAPAPVQTRQLDDERLLAWFEEDLGGRGARLTPPERDAALGVFRAVVTAVNAYRGEPLPADITVVRARDGRVSEFADHPHTGEPDWGWRSLGTRAVTVHTVAGTHHTLLTGPGLASVAGAIRDDRTTRR